MRIVSIKEAKNMVGEIVPCIKGKIKDVWDYKTGTKTKIDEKTGKSKTFDWKLQNLLIEDETGTIKIFITGRHEIPKNFKGSGIILESSQTKHGVKGILVEETEYEGKKGLQLRVDLDAEMHIDGLTTHTIVNKTEIPDGQVSAPPHKPQNRLPPVAQNGHIEPNGEQKVDRRLNQIKCLYAKCWITANSLGDTFNWEKPQRKDVASCFYLTLVKEGLADEMPNDKPVNGNGNGHSKHEPSPEDLEDAPEHKWEADNVEPF